MPSAATTAHHHHDTARRNHAGGARLLDGEWEHPFAEGTFRNVGRGIYTSGRRKNQECAIKWMKGRHSLSSTYFRYDIRATDKALEIIKRFNNAGIVNHHIRLNIPEIWELGEAHGYPAGTKVLIEPFIDDFRKWNSNTGWNNSSVPWGRVMQALSHYSYYISDGQLVLCDLQGGFYSNGAVVTDPAICSRTNSYGLTDMGKDGIYNFFAHHRCNEFCKDYWYKPRRTKKVFRARRSTTMWNAHTGREV